MKLLSMMPWRTRTETGEARETSTRPQTAKRGAKGSTSISGGLRNLADKEGAPKQTAAAQSLNDKELRMMLNNPYLNGPGARAVRLEAAARGMAPSTPKKAQPKAPPKPLRTSMPSDAMGHALDEPTTSRQTEHAGQEQEIPSAGEGAVEQEPSRAVEPEASVPAAVETPAQSAIALPAGAVIDSETGELEAAHLEQTVDALAAALPELAASVASAHPRAKELRAKLKQQLSDIATAAKATNRRPDQKGLAVRDGFAKAAGTSKVLARYLERNYVNRAADDEGQARACDRARSYYLVSGLMTELKRTHLSATALDLMKECADREVERLERVAPGISQRVSGPNVATNTGVSLDYSVGIGNVSGSASNGREFFADDDRDIDFWKLRGGAVQGGVGGKISKLAASANLQFMFQGGEIYFETDTVDEMVKMVLNMDANHPMTIKSAGPKTRKLVHGWERFKDTVSLSLGRNYAPAPGRPYFLGDKKVAKGFNGVKMALLARGLDEELPSDGGRARFSSIVEAAYPAVGDVVRQRLADDQPLPPATRRDVPDSVMYADRLVAFRETTGAFNGSLGVSASGDSNLGADGAFSLTLRGDLLQFFMESANAPHQILDPAHYKDLKQTLSVHSQLDALCDPHPPAALALYDTMRKRLQGEGRADPMLALSQGVAKTYGDGPSIPAQFRNAIARPDTVQLERAGAEAEGLKRLYLDFIKDAATVLARSDRFLPRSAQSDLETQRREAVARINKEVWQGRHPEADALAQPEKFVAASHASISLALGAVGTHITIAKERLSDNDNENHAPAEIQADRNYAEARELLDKNYLPMKKYDVQKNGPLKEQALWQRKDVLLRATGSGGAAVNALGAVLGRGNKSLGPVSITNDTGGLALSAEGKYLYADYQTNPSRTGEFLQFTLTATGGKPLAGAALEAAVRRAVGKYNAALATGKPKIETAEIARQMQGLEFDASEGSSIVMKFRQPPDLSVNSYRLQYVRVLNNQNAGLNVEVPIATHVGVFTPGISHTDASQGFEGEIRGSDLSYLLMQHPPLAAVLENQDALTAEELKARFDDNLHVRNGYFATPSTIIDTLQDYKVFLEAQAERDHTPIERASKVNEFFRYFASEPFLRIAQQSQRVQQFAPGATASGERPAPASEPLTQDVSLDGFDLAAAKTRLEAAGTIEARTEYLCGEGRALLVAFAKIIGKVREINYIAMFHTEQRNIGFQTVLPDGLSRESAAIQAAVHGGKPSRIGDRLQNRLRPVRGAVSELPVDEVERLANAGTPSALRMGAQVELARRNAKLGRT